MHLHWIFFYLKVLCFIYTRYICFTSRWVDMVLIILAWFVFERLLTITCNEWSNQKPVTSTKYVYTFEFNHTFLMIRFSANELSVLILLCTCKKICSYLCLLDDAPKAAVNTLRPRQNGHRFADDTFKRIFLNENVRISIKISLKFVPKGPFNKYSSIGSDNGLAPVRRQAIIWTNDVKFTDAYTRHSASMS